MANHDCGMHDAGPSRVDSEVIESGQEAQERNQVQAEAGDW